MERIGFITFEKTSNRPRNTMGSTRIRARWVYEQWDEAEEYQIGKEYDVLIYQKVYWEDMMQNFDGIQILDLCDPDWLEGRDVMKYCAMADAVTTSTEPLAEYIRKFVDTPVYCVPDRIKMEEMITTPKEVNEKIETAMWYGYSQNAHYLEGAVAVLKKHGVKMRLVADKPLTFGGDIEVTNIKYNYPNVWHEVHNADICILPETSGVDLRGIYKSNNKTICAWACGTPVARTLEDFERLLTKEAREQEMEKRAKEIQDKWLVKYSVDQYKEILNALH
jgi:hypothetical protein